MSSAEKIEIYVKEYLYQLNEAECQGARRARNTLIYVHQHKAKIEIDFNKKRWHEEEAKRLNDDDQWNTVMEQL
jgi:hypothetical protein